VAQEQESRGRASRFIKDLVPDWRPSRNQMLWAARIVIVLGVMLGILTLISVPFGITPWDWLKVLAVPITIGAAVPLINWLQQRRELEFEDRRARTDALLQFLEQLTQLLLDKQLDKQNARLVKMEITEDIRELISARAEAIGPNLDPQGNQSLTNFLVGLGLLHKENPIISLAGRNFSGVDWRGANLSGADLSGTKLYEADLGEANLSGAKLHEADLSRADLSGADLSEADLSWTNLSEADLSGAYLSGVNLYGANLIEADLSAAVLSEADLSGAYLSGANLSGVAGITTEALEQQNKVLQGVILPNGQMYEDWLKSKGPREDRENNGPS
jgi:uncharacterized protein YjbI with pentapeptide repeats